MSSLTGSRVLVAGGAGFIGSHLVTRIGLEQPSELTAVDNCYLGNPENLLEAREVFPSLRFEEVDAAAHRVLEDLVEGIDVVFNLAVVPLPASLQEPAFAFDVNCKITLELCELLRRGSFGALVQFSSSEIYGTAQFLPMDETHPVAPLTPYAASKAACDHLVDSYRQTFGVEAVIVRPFNTFGPRQNDGGYAAVVPRVMRRALRGLPVEIYGDGEQTRDFTYVRDVAEAAVRVATEPAARGRTINVGSGTEISINRLVARIIGLIEADVEIRHGPERAGDVRRHCAATDLAQRLLSFRPSTGIDEGLRLTLDWYRSRDEPLER